MQEAGGFFQSGPGLSPAVRSAAAAGPARVRSRCFGKERNGSKSGSSGLRFCGPSPPPKKTKSKDGLVRPPPKKKKKKKTKDGLVKMKWVGGEDGAWWFTSPRMKKRPPPEPSLTADAAPSHQPEPIPPNEERSVPLVGVEPNRFGGAPKLIS